MSGDPIREARAERLMAWVDDIQLSGRVGFPVYRNPGEMKADIRALVGEAAALRERLTWISDPTYVGNYSDAEVIEIHRKWASEALAGVVPAQPAEEEK